MSPEGNDLRVTYDVREILEDIKEELRVVTDRLDKKASTAEIANLRLRLTTVERTLDDEVVRRDTLVHAQKTLTKSRITAVGLILSGVGVIGSLVVSILALFIK